MKAFGMMLAAFIFLQLNTIAQRLEKLWETDTIFRVPESVLFDARENTLYVSNIDGASGAKDGKGHISKMTPDGKVINLTWVTGLNAPKGMATWENILFVADVDAVVEIDKKTGKILRRTEIPGAKFLNDLAINDVENVYVSDSETGIIHEVAHGQSKPVITGRTRPNGVLWFDEHLYFADAGALYRREFDGKVVELATGMERSTDGIEPIDEENFLVSSWIGSVYLVSPDGKVKELLNTKDKGINTADIGFDRANKIIYIPTFNSNRVVAYKFIPK